MAISKTLALLNTLEVPNAYIRVDTVSGNADKITASVNIYLSQAAFEGTAPFTEPQSYLEQVIFDFAPDVSDTGKNFIEQAYANLKAQDRFAGALDC